MRNLSGKWNVSIRLPKDALCLSLVFSGQAKGKKPDGKLRKPNYFSKGVP